MIEMKKTKIIALIIALTFALTACQGKVAEKENMPEELTVESEKDSLLEEQDEVQENVSELRSEESVEDTEGSETLESFENFESIEEEIESVELETVEPIAVYATDKVNIRYEPSLDAEVFMQAERGTSFSKMGETDEWSMVPRFSHPGTIDRTVYKGMSRNPPPSANRACRRGRHPRGPGKG